MKPWFVECPIAHRGSHKGREIPENSLASFRKSLELGYPIEMDVHITVDGHVVIHHDEDLERMSGVQKNIAEETLEEIQSYKLYETDERTPTLKEALELVRGKVPIVIELKSFNFDGRLEQGVYDLVKNYQGEFSIQSFNPFSLEWFLKKDSSIIRGLLSYSFNDITMSFHHKLVLKYFFFIKKAKPDYIGYAWDELDALGIAFIRRFSSLPILAWAVETKRDWEKISPYCHNIIFENFEIPCKK